MRIRRVFMDFIMSVFCLGIPYLFMDRSSHSRIDEESGMRGQGPLLIIGACACLVVSLPYYDIFLWVDN